MRRKRERGKKLRRGIFRLIELLDYYDYDYDFGKIDFAPKRRFERDGR